MGEVTSRGGLLLVDLGTPDVEGSTAFYAGLLGWETEDVPAGEATYRDWRKAGKDVCGMHAHPQPDAAAAAL